MLSFPSYKHALIYYIAVTAVLFSGFFSYVAAPHRQGIEIGVTFGISQHAPIRWGLVAGLLLLPGLLIAEYDRTRPLLLMLALASVLVMTSYPLMLKQDPAEIAMTSPLVEQVRGNLPPGSRYAVAAPGVSVLPPNLNATLGLASVHSYNSLSSTRYHTLIQSLGGEGQTYGRWNGAISPDYAGGMFWMSNIGLILSPEKLGHQNLESLGEESGSHLYRVISRMGESLQIVPPQLDMSAKKMVLDDPRGMITTTPVKILDQGDVLEFEIKPSAPSVFLLSQKFHRDWEALAETDHGWQATQTVEVNGVFQGVLVPHDTRRVRLEFKLLPGTPGLHMFSGYCCSCWQVLSAGRGIDERFWSKYEKDK